MPAEQRFIVSGNIVDIPAKDIFYGEAEITGSKISRIRRTGPENPAAPYILPGFIDSHVHVESSMLIPSEFARLAVLHGTTGTVSDPHEIANVCGMQGVKFMIENAAKVPFKFHFGAPSCVPATVFETAGAALDVQQVEELLDMPEIFYLSEMMNFPGVLHGDAEVTAKIAAAKKEISRQTGMPRAFAAKLQKNILMRDSAPTTNASPQKKRWISSPAE